MVICCLGLDAGLEGEEGDQGNQPDSLPYPTENPWDLLIRKEVFCYEILY